MAVQASIGSISSGTLKQEDLITCFISTLGDLRNDLVFSLDAWEPPKNIKAIEERIDRLDTGMEKIKARITQSGYFCSQDSYLDLSWLMDALDTFAPDNAFFGARPGPAADFGFWVSGIVSYQTGCKCSDCTNERKRTKD